METRTQRDYFPILLNLKDQPCLVIGGGMVAYRKVGSLLQAGARVRVISPETVAQLEALADSGDIALEKRHYRSGDLKNCRLAFAATNQRAVNEACRKEAMETGVLLNVVDVPDLCDFIMPAVHQQGDLLLMVCSQGKSPMLSKRIRKEFEKRYGPAYGYVSRVLGHMRTQAFKDFSDIHQRKALFQHLIEEGPIDQALTASEKNAETILWKAYEAKAMVLKQEQNTTCQDVGQ